MKNHYNHTTVVKHFKSLQSFQKTFLHLDYTHTYMEDHKCLGVFYSKNFLLKHFISTKILYEIEVFRFAFEIYVYTFKSTF